MTTRRAGNPVSLFPFLAVLVCAMGALIFLLLVVTRQIRAEVRAEAIRDARQDNVADSFPVPAPESPTAVVEEAHDRLPEIDDVPPAPVGWNRMIDE
ncbi:MAG: putative porin, partial [Planctomycetales bacterium]|nr:putative porin [Planctomycetales bacterium]